MRRNYLWGWQISEEGFKALMPDHMTPEEQGKRWYVHEFLHPSVHEAKCGWYGLNYVVCENPWGDRREYVLMYAEPNDTPNSARWINVTGGSKGAIAEAVWGLVFA